GEDREVVVERQDPGGAEYDVAGGGGADDQVDLVGHVRVVVQVEQPGAVDLDRNTVGDLIAAAQQQHVGVGAALVVADEDRAARHGGHAGFFVQQQGPREDAGVGVVPVGRDPREFEGAPAAFDDLDVVVDGPGDGELAAGRHLEERGRGVQDRETTEEAG